MTDAYPYMMSNNKIPGILDSIKTAAKPQKLTHEWLSKMGFTSSNDRAVIPLLKRLGFLIEDGTPTQYYDDLRDQTRQPYILGDRVKELYKDLYQINTEIHSRPEIEIKGAFSRISGKDETSVNRFYNTYKALVALSKFETRPAEVKEASPEKIVEPTKKVELEKVIKSAEFHYNIQIHLPATTEISVYNAIFKSLKDNLLMD